MIIFFTCTPLNKKIPKAKRLQEWYRRMLQKAIIEGIVVDYKNILKDALDHQLVSPTEIPYFEGDFWPNTLEDILKVSVLSWQSVFHTIVEIFCVHLLRFILWVVHVIFYYDLLKASNYSVGRISV